MEIDSQGWARLLGRLRGRLWPSADCEDLLHAAFLRFERYRQTVPVRDHEGFLLRTAVNIGIDEQRRGRWIDHRLIDSACETFAAPAPLQDEALAARERLARVKEGLDRLDPKTRRIFLMQRLEGKKYREIAVELGLSQSAVEKHIAKATQFLVEWAEGW
jgi:RNA polymerase sigma-70 factor (ECF subfamily)